MILGDDMIEAPPVTRWGSFKTILIATILVVPSLFFLTVITWGTILIPLVAVLYLAPLAGLNYLLWGRRFSRAVANPPDEIPGPPTT